MANAAPTPAPLELPAVPEAAPPAVVPAVWPAPVPVALFCSSNLLLVSVAPHARAANLLCSVASTFTSPVA